MYASVVTTLLALMDGVSDRGNVVVIGATNRPDGIDPGLRRPGRFDREVCLQLPSAADRAAILQVHTRSWPCPPSEALVQALASATEGFAGADLAALCTGAVMQSARRNLPDIADVLDLAGNQGTEEAQADAEPQAQDQRVGHPAAELLLKQRLGNIQVLQQDWVSALSAAPPPCSLREGTASLAWQSMHPPPLPYHLAPAVLPVLRRALRCAHLSGAELPGKLAVAAEMTSRSAGRSSDDELEQLLLSMNAIEAPVAPTPSQAAHCRNGAAKQRGSTRAEGEGRTLKAQRKADGVFPACRLLLCAEGDRGQPLVAGLFLSLAGSPVTVVGLPQILAAGEGNALSGVAKVLDGARSAHPSGGAATPVIVFLPRLDAWALEPAIDAHADAPTEGGVDDGMAAAASPPKPAAISTPAKGRQSCAGPHSFAGLQLPDGLTTAGRQEHPAHRSGRSGRNAPAAQATVTAAWNALEASVAALAKQQQVIVIGTCYRSEASLPDAIARFFSPHGASRTGVVPVCADLAGGSSALLTRTACRAATAAAIEVACAIHAKLVARHRRNLPADGHPSARPAPREKIPSGQGAPEGGVKEPSAGVNEATLQWGQSLHAQIQRSLCVLGQRLLGDRRARMIRWPDAAHGLPESRDMLAGVPFRMHSMQSFARAMAMGYVGGLDTLLAILAAWYSLTQQADEAAGRASPASSAFAALRDEIDAWVYALKKKLQLDTAAAQAALSAALAARHEEQLLLHGAARKAQAGRPPHGEEAKPSSEAGRAPAGRAAEESGAPLASAPMRGHAEAGSCPAAADARVEAPHRQEGRTSPRQAAHTRLKARLQAWTVQLAELLRLSLIPPTAEAIKQDALVSVGVLLSLASDSGKRAGHELQVAESQGAGAADALPAASHACALVLAQMRRGAPPG